MGTNRDRLLFIATILLVTLSIILVFTNYKNFRDKYFSNNSDKPNVLASQTKTFYGNNLNVLKMFGQGANASYGDISYGEVSTSQIHHASGVAIDTTSANPRVYIVDTGNNRILGFSDINQTVPNAQIVLGQSGFTQASCNRDSNVGNTNTTDSDKLCLTPVPTSTNIEEYWMRTSIDVDSQGNLYVPDIHNNRVLKYLQPFSTDKTGGKGDKNADFVWGQQDFIQNKPNLGLGIDARSANSLHFGKDARFDHVSSRGVSVDKDGNVWVADTYNFRVLRFPPNSKTANLVIGQPNFNSPTASNVNNFYNTVCTISPSQRATNTTCTPTLARVHPVTGKLYVLDESTQAFKARLLVFNPPFANGMAASAVIYPKQTGAFTNSSNIFFNQRVLHLILTNKVNMQMEQSG